MSTAERFPNPPELDPYDELTPPPVEDLHAGRQPSPKRTTRRWEFGFFVRKIVNGWLAYYKQFPPSSRPKGSTPALPRSPLVPPGTAEGDSVFDGAVKPLSGHSMGNDDGGPIGQTRFEAGFFLSGTTETTGDGGEET